MSRKLIPNDKPAIHYLTKWINKTQTKDLNKANNEKCFLHFL